MLPRCLAYISIICSYIYISKRKKKTFQPAFVQFVRLVLECQQEINATRPPVDSYKHPPAKQPSSTGVLSLQPVNRADSGIGVYILNIQIHILNCINIYDMNCLSRDLNIYIYILYQLVMQMLYKDYEKLVSVCSITFISSFNSI